MFNLDYGQKKIKLKTIWSNISFIDCSHMLFIKIFMYIKKTCRNSHFEKKRSAIAIFLSSLQTYGQTNRHANTGNTIFSQFLKIVTRITENFEN